MRLPHFLRTARMAGTSIAAPDAAAWVTDFLNAAYYGRPHERREVDDVRLAFTILTTAWHRQGARLRAGDLADFHRAFGRDRIRGTLSREQLLAGADRLFGDDFSAGYSDLGRRGWGIVFRDRAALAAYDPARRLEDGALRELTPPRKPPADQVWHTYEPVRVPSAAEVLGLLSQTRRWPEFASELGRFTAVRDTGLLGQTFEIEVVARVTRRTPAFTRGYVTATNLLDPGAELDSYVAGFQVDALPDGATPRAVLELTTHDGHFLGRGISRLLLYEHEGAEWLRDVGSWDPLPPHLALGYHLGGKRAQSKFWGDGCPEREPAASDRARQRGACLSRSGVRSATERAPHSAIVRSSSARNILSTCSTPSAPPSARPQR